ncbi:MAG: 2-oxoacid:acceptor oxidoreductase family protein, partial [bacterium]
PSFGAERRGAPVTASNRLSPRSLRVLSQIEYPSVVIVLDETLLSSGNATDGLKQGGWMIMNSPKEPTQIGINDGFSIATADASSAAHEAGLIISGMALVNTAMLGAFSRATGIISLESIRTAIAASFPPAAAQKNYEAARLTYERTIMNSV